MKIDRRDFLKSGVAVSSLALVPDIASAAPMAAAPANPFAPMPGKWRSFEVTTHIEIQAPKGDTRIWLPVPTIEQSEWSHPISSYWQLNGGATSTQTQQVGRYGVKMIAIERGAGSGKPTLDVVSSFAARDRAIDLSKPRAHAKLSAADRKLFLASTAYIPTDGIVKATADKITAGSKDDLTKARKIYEWIVLNTFRNPKTRGCGLGDISYMLTSGDLGGKCADLNGLMVGLARASGIPARDIYGIRVAPSKFGYKALGANTPNITGSQHCRSEIYLSNFGWVPVDPADVRKVILEEPPGNLAMSDAKVQNAHETLFGAWEGNWMGYNFGHDVALPGSPLKPVAFLMYPQAQTADGELDCLDAASFQYTITAKEITA